MAEVLSQNQIDLLLASMHGGGDEVKEKHIGSVQKDKKYRKYDFYSPKKFTKDKLRLLRDVFDKFARIANSQINSLFRLGCEIEVKAIEEQRYYEFANALNDRDVLANVVLYQQDARMSKPLLIHMTVPIMLNFMDRLMGGEGDMEVEQDYTYTEVERALYKNIMSYFAEGLGDSWNNYISLRAEYKTIEDNPTMLQIIGVDETVLIVVLEITAENGMSGRLSICFSGDLLSDIFAVYDKRNSRESDKVVDHAEDIMETLKESPVNVRAVLGRVNVSMKDLYELQKGDVIRLNKPKDSPVEIEVEGVPWFHGNLGQKKSKTAVLIHDIHEVHEIKQEPLLLRAAEETMDKER